MSYCLDEVLITDLELFGFDNEGEFLSQIDGGSLSNGVHLVVKVPVGNIDIHTS